MKSLLQVAWPLLLIALLPTALAQSGTWAGVQYQPSYFGADEQVTIHAESFADGFEDGFNQGAYDYHYGLRRMETQLPAWTNDRIYDTEQASIRVRVETDRDEASFRVGYVLGYYQGYERRQHPEYEEIAPYTRNDPFYRGNRLRLDYPDFDRERRVIRVRTPAQPFPLQGFAIHHVKRVEGPTVTSDTYWHPYEMRGYYPFIRPVPHMAWPYPHGVNFWW